MASKPTRTRSCKKARSSISSSRPAKKACKANRACVRSEEHTSELQSHLNLVCRLLLEKKKKKKMKERTQVQSCRAQNHIKRVIVRACRTRHTCIALLLSALDYLSSAHPPRYFLFFFF